MSIPNACTSLCKNQAAEIIPTMNDSQLRRAKKLIRSLCANYDYGNCIMLDNQYGTCVCPQLISFSLLCKYFRTAVLPADRGLHAEITATDSQRRCGDCLQPFVPERPNTLYCSFCVLKRKRTRNREWMRKNREKSGQSNPPKALYHKSFQMEK